MAVSYSSKSTVSHACVLVHCLAGRWRTDSPEI